MQPTHFVLELSLPASQMILVNAQETYLLYQFEMHMKK
jgi:hypothetical protein